MKGDDSLPADFIAGTQEDQEEEEEAEAVENHGGGRGGAPARLSPQLGRGRHTARLI